MKASRFLLLLFLLMCSPSFGSSIKGNVVDENNQPMPFVSVYLKNTTHGVSTDQAGFFYLDLKPGKHTIVFSFIGYQTREEVITLKNGETQTLNIQLQPDAAMLHSVEISSDYKDFAREIARKARDYRRDQDGRLKNFSVKSYQKVTLDKEYKERDTTLADSLDIDEKDRKKLVRNTVELIESLSLFHFDPPGKFKEEVIAFINYSEVRSKRGSIGRGGGASFSVEFGESQVAPQLWENVNPYLIIRNQDLYEIDLYKNLIELPGICQKPLLSPLAGTAPLNYSYDYGGIIVDEERRKIYRILVKPLYPGEALFEGTLFIADSSFALVGADLTVNPRVLTYCRELKIVVNYKEIQPGLFLPVRREIDYSIKDGKAIMYGTVSSRHSDYVINQGFPEKFFGAEFKKYAEDAFDKDSSFWAGQRHVILRENEVKYVHKTDSLREYYSSEEYFKDLDSNFNRINIWSFLVNGIGHRNRVKGNEFFINPLVMQVVPFGIGGYRHRFGGYFNHEYENGMLLETDGEIDYGFKNKDIKGRGGVGLTYNPKKFVRTYVRFGDYYDMINNYASVSTFFSRSNYARNRMFSVAQRMEIINGLYAELTYEFSDQSPITGLQMDSWSQDVFDSLNTPTAFDRYTKSELRLQMTYRIKQPYVIKKGRKIVYATKYPELSFLYRKGIPGLFNSEVNFDYLEFGARYEGKLARLGNYKWNVVAGSFVNRSSLRILEYRYFRGSDPFIFSDPLKSFQLLGPSLNTATAFFRASIIHHFDGVLLSKIPVISWFKISMAAGAGTLLMPEENFAHFEMFGGIERVIRIRRQLIRLGAYAVTSDNNIENADFEVKFGISFFNPFTGKYDY